MNFVSKGFPQLGIDRQTASNHVVDMLRQAWFNFCKANGFVEYQYSNAVGFHASPEQALTGHRIPWGRQRSSMLRNVAKEHICQFGVTATPFLWPFWHFKLKARVLFLGDKAPRPGWQSTTRERCTSCGAASAKAGATSNGLAVCPSSCWWASFYPMNRWQVPAA